MEVAKKIGKEILSKLPVFIFCVVFIKFYNKYMGYENNIVGIAILTGFFMFMKNDFAFKVKQATLCIPLMYLIIAVAPHFSLMNPYLGVAINFVAISLILIISCYDISEGNHIPFLMAYLFCQGYDVSGHLYNLRVASLMVASLVIAGIYLAVNHKKKHDMGFTDVFKGLNLKSERLQWYLRMVVTLVLVMFVGDLLNYPRTMWVSLTILSLTTPFGEDHKERGKARIPAAILGTAVFYILFELVIPNDYQLYFVMGAGFIAMFIQNYFIKSIYNSFSALGTAVLFFPVANALALRVVSNIIGTIIAVVSYFIFNLIFKKMKVLKEPNPEEILKNRENKEKRKPGGWEV